MVAGLAESPVVSPEDARAHLFGRYTQDNHGPLLVVVGALHGNEPAGLLAAERVLAELEARAPGHFRGELLAVRGNIQALEAQVRYLATDLNRAFTPERMARLARGEIDASVPEDREQAELMALLDELLPKNRERPVIMIDCHTASAKSVPFMLIGDNLPNWTFASHFPLPVVLGLEEQIDGALLEHFNSLGHITLGVEGGKHDNPESVDCIAAVLWIALVAAGMVTEDYPPDYRGQHTLLREAAGDLPRFLEVRHRHPVEPGDGFVMQPDYVNFQPVASDELLATDDKQGEIRSPRDALILLPLYQGWGSDGFFLATELKPFWLRVSALLRRTGLASLMGMLPGVRRAPEEYGPEAYLVDTRVARYYPREIFHLFGFRKRREMDGHQVLVCRRRQLDSG